MMAGSVRVLFSCTGIGILNRGIESFFREAFDGLKNTPGLDAKLIKGAADRHEIGGAKSDEYGVWCLRRTGWTAPLVGKLTARSAYAVEQWSSFPGVVRQIRRFRPDVIFYSDANLGFLLYRFRRQIGVPFRLLFSNGGPCHPPFARTDFVHQVAPFYLDEALAAGEPPEKHFMVPYGIHIPAKSPVADPAIKRALRQRLGLPTDRPVVLSVGWIARQHKRMDYVINEVARMPEPRPFLQLLGAMDAASQEIVSLGTERLGTANFSVKSVPYEEVKDFYRAADIFVLASLKEGFGRVYLEALMHGLPTIGHDHPVIRYVLGDVGICTDLSCEGGLTNVIMHLLRSREANGDVKDARRESVAKRFGWEALQSSYLEMFQKAAKGLE